MQRRTPSRRYASSVPDFMPREHSFKITLSNNRTEKEAVEYARIHDPQLRIPDKAGRREILRALEVPSRLSRAFDAIRVPDHVGESHSVALADVETLELIEVKATKARIETLPFGFFFGATANEFELAELLGDRFRFCFICLHPETPGLCYLTAKELEPLVRTKRIQYQINIRRQPTSPVDGAGSGRSTVS